MKELIRQYGHGNRGCDGTGIDCAGVGNQRGCGKGNSKEPRTV